MGPCDVSTPTKRPSRTVTPVGDRYTLVNVDTESLDCGRISPDNSIMTGNRPWRVVGRPKDRVMPASGHVKLWTDLADAGGVQKHGIDPESLIQIGSFPLNSQLVLRMRDLKQPSWCE
jgi:hypothetical protein